jgi:hypothetical protein
MAVSNRESKSKKRSIWEKIFAPFGFLTVNPTNPYKVPLSTTAPKDLLLIHSAPTPAEADLLRQMLHSAGFHVEYVPPATTGAFGSTGSVHVYVRANEKKDACEFISQLWETPEQEYDGVEGL